MLSAFPGCLKALSSLASVGVLCLVSGGFVRAEVVGAEYYLGADPGEGNGVPLSLSDTTSVSAGFESVDISLVGLDPGTYDVGVRVKDDQDRWSNAVIKRFTLAAGDFELAGGLDRTGDANQGVTIGEGPGGFDGGVVGEYFLGDDPGEGGGVALSLSEGSSLSAAFEAAEISLTDLDPGTYDVGVRVKDDEDRWSNVVIKRFTLAAGDFELAGGLDRTGDANQGVTIGEGPGGFGGGVVGEYFLGNDPGEGGGVELSLSEGSSLSAAFEAAEISLTDLDPGTYDVGVRVKDDQDRWSNSVIKRFTLAAGDFELAGGLDRTGDANQGVTIGEGPGGFGGGVVGEYFLGDDPGEGNGVALSLSEGSSLSAAFEAAEISLTDLDPGTYDVGVRVKDDQDRWSNAVIKRFTLAAGDFELAGGLDRTGDANQGVTIGEGPGGFGGGVVGEYFLGNDPGEGNGVELSLSEGSSLSAAFEAAEISLTDLDPGTYDVGVRVKDDEDRWSNAVIKRFTLAAGDFELAGGLDRTGDANQGVTIGQGPGGFGGGVVGEYFLGSDPGEGNGVALSLSEGSSLSAAFEAAEISLTDLDPGTYDVGVRVKDDQDRWSNAVIKRFTLYGSQLVQLTEDAVLNGETPAALKPAKQSWQISLLSSLPTNRSTLQIGDFETVIDRGQGETDEAFVDRILQFLQDDPRLENLVTFRKLGAGEFEVLTVQDGRVAEDFVVGTGELESLLISEGRIGSAEAKIVAAEYFVGTDPGEGQGEPVENVEVLTDGNQATTSAFGVPIANLRAGTHRVGLRFQNAAGLWGEPVFRSFTSFTILGIQDEVPPTINLTGGASYSIFVGEEYSEPGFTAVDGFDGDLTSRVVVSGEINTAWPGIQLVSYEVRDFAGNMTRVTREVEVLVDPRETRNLVTTAAENGSITGAGVYELGANATLVAIPDLGYVFETWTGDASGSDSPLLFFMDLDSEVGAIFNKDLRDSDQDGISNYDELLVYQTDPNDADSDGDGFNDGFEVVNNTDLNSTSSKPPMDLGISVSKANDLLFGVFSITPPVGGIIAIEETRDLKTWTQIETFAGDGEPFLKPILPSGKETYYRLRLIDQSP